MSINISITALQHTFHCLKHSSVKNNNILYTALCDNSKKKSQLEHPESQVYKCGGQQWSYSN